MQLDNKRLKMAAMGEAYGMGDIRIGLITGKYPNESPVRVIRLRDLPGTLQGHRGGRIIVADYRAD